VEKAMKKFIILILTLATFVAGCEKNITETMYEDTRRGVFQNYIENNPIPQGYAELTVFSSLKTPLPGIYPYGSKIIGTPDFMLLINIDGQKTLVKGDLSKEISEPKGLDDTEAGEGIRYLFKKDLLLKAGVHKLFAALPEDHVAVEKELVLREGTSNTFRIDPIYGSSQPGGTRGRGMFSSSSFMNGITGFWLFLNGSEM
jgi:hypothetical protein